MPTIAASFASLPRIASAIAATSFSGSGSDALMALGLVEKRLQDDGGGERVDVGLARGAGAGLAKLGFRRGGSERLVDQHHLTLVAARQAPRELAGEPRHLVLRAVGMLRLPDHEG